MSDKREPNDLSIDELKELLYLKRRSKRQKRLRRMKAEGRLVEFSDIVDHDLVNSPTAGSKNGELAQEPPESGEDQASAPSAQMPLSESWVAVEPKKIEGPGGYSGPDPDVIIDFVPAPKKVNARKKRRGWNILANRVLLLVEIGAVAALILLAYFIWQTNQELNQEIAEVQQAASSDLAIPTPEPTPIIGVIILPSGHKPPVNGQPPEPGEAGDIPEHLLPILNAYVPPPIPTPGPEQARRIQIPALELDKPIVQGDSWEELKKGVGQHIGSGQPGRNGNIVLSAHNDIYGEIFRYLDQLSPGDEIIISTERQSYTYVVSDLQVVAPTDVWVMAPTEYASATLISCYPYLVNNKRIVVFADLAAQNPLS